MSLKIVSLGTGAPAELNLNLNPGQMRPKVLASYLQASFSDPKSQNPKSLLSSPHPPFHSPSPLWPDLDAAFPSTNFTTLKPGDCFRAAIET